MPLSTRLPHAALAAFGAAALFASPAAATVVAFDGTEDVTTLPAPRSARDDATGAAVAVAAGESVAATGLAAADTYRDGLEQPAPVGLWTAAGALPAPVSVTNASAAIASAARGGAMRPYRP